MRCPNPDCRCKDIIGASYRGRDGKLLTAFAVCPSCGNYYRAEVKECEKATPINGDRLAEVRAAA